MGGASSGVVVPRDPRDHPAGPVCVLFIGAHWRSGSTLLDLMLGQLPGFVAVGELRQIWQKGCIEDRRCGCGATFSACPFWIAVGDAAFGGWRVDEARELARIRTSLDRASAVPRHLVRGIPGGSDDAAGYRHALDHLLRAIRDVSGSTVVVDSSKAPAHAMFLDSLDTVDLRFLHLVRDPRAVGFSRMRRRHRKAAVGESDRSSGRLVADGALRWLAYNTLVPRLIRNARRGTVRYEDLAATPGPVLEEVLVRTGFRVSPEALDFIGDGTIDVDPHHIVFGNPMRFAHGRIAVSPDEEWRTAMPRRDRQIVAAITAPLRGRFGYGGG